MTFDGTLAEHYWPERGAYDAYRIGNPIEAMVQRVRTWLAAGIEVRVFTARVGPRDGRADEHVEKIKQLIAAWTERHIGTALAATCVKDHAMLELWDDRAVHVVHNTGERCCNVA